MPGNQKRTGYHLDAWRSRRDKPLQTSTITTFIGGVSLTKGVEEQEGFMTQTILNPLEEFKVETEPPPQMKSEAQLFDAVLFINEVRTTHKRTDVNNMLAPWDQKDRK